MSQHLKSSNKNNIMDAMCSKKIPFTSSERELIVALVRERPIIEDKRTNAKNIELKKQAWEDLTAAFNSHSYVSQRNNTQLKRCWENIKTQRKKELSQEAASLRRTGGGPPDAGPSSSDNMVDIICPYINLKVPNVIDSNSIEILSDLEKEDNFLDYTMELEKEFDGEINENVPPPPKKKLKEIDTPTNNKTKMTEKIDGVKKCDDDERDFLLPPQRRTLKDFNTPTSRKNLITETQARIKRVELNTQHDQALFELRLERERIIIQRERNLLEFETIMHKLQKEKIELEIRNLKQEK